MTVCAAPSRIEHGLVPLPPVIWRWIMGKTMPIELTLQNYLWVQAIVFLAGIAFLLWKPKQKPGLRLKFDKTSGPAPKKGGISVTTPPSSGGVVEFKGNERVLQVYFNYNGETFEAYEVFGVPAGSSLARVEQAIREQKNLQGPESRAFVDCAFQALKSSLNSSKN